MLPLEKKIKSRNKLLNQLKLWKSLNKVDEYQNVIIRKKYYFATRLGKKINCYSCKFNIKNQNPIDCKKYKAIDIILEDVTPGPSLRWFCLGHKFEKDQE